MPFHIGDGINDRQTVFKGTGGFAVQNLLGGSDPLDYTLDVTLWPPGRRASAWDGSDLIRCVVNGLRSTRTQHPAHKLRFRAFDWDV